MTNVKGQFLNPLVPRPKVAVEYDRNGERVTKQCETLGQARALWKQKFEAGRNPKIVKAD